MQLCPFFSSVTVAQMSLDDKQVVTNVRCAIDKIIESAPGGKDNIRSIHLLRRGTVALPLYMCTGIFQMITLLM